MANRSFEMYEIRQIIQRLRLGESNRAIARAQRVGRNTVKAVRAVTRAQGWLDSATPIPEDAVLAERFKVPRTATQNLPTVEPHREVVLAWRAQGIAITTMHRALVRNHGFSGSVHTLYRFFDSLGDTVPQATVILEFAPGESAQVDFGQGPLIIDRHTGEYVKTWIFVMTLACHRHAFEWLNGVPRRIRIDNPKCAVTRACYREPEVQRAYGELALGYGFTIDPCPPRDPKKKGRVEAGVKYAKGSFLPLREFHSLSHSNAELKEWIMGEAGNRIHGTTRERPLTLFIQPEHALLLPLPTVAPECSVWAKAKVHGNGHVHYERCLYSVPFRLIRETLWLQITPTTVASPTTMR